MYKKKESFSDQEIIEAIEQDKNLTKYIDYLYKVNYRSVRYYILTNSGAEEDAQDMFHEAICAFVTLVRNKRFRKASAVGTIIFAIAKKRWLYELRRKRHVADRRDNQIGELDEVIAEFESLYGKKQAIRQVGAVITTLAEGCKQVLTYFFFERLSYEEILDRLPQYKNIDVLKTKKYYCWKLLKKKLKDHLDDYKSTPGNY